MSPRGAARAGTLRAFVAFELDAELRARIADAASGLRDAIAGVRFVAPVGIHLTLRFLGRTRPDQVEALRTSLQAAAAACPPLPVRVSGLGLFPASGPPRVLWLGIAAPAPLAELQAACERAACAAGFPAEARPFTPHLTLGRWRERAPRPRLPELDLGATVLETLSLVRSEPRPEGSRYTALLRFPLAASS